MTILCRSLASGQAGLRAGTDPAGGQGDRPARGDWGAVRMGISPAGWLAVWWSVHNPALTSALAAILAVVAVVTAVVTWRQRRR
jgi:hypothetical protein